MTEPVEKAAKATATAKKAARRKVATKDASKAPTKRAPKKVSVKEASSTGMFRDPAAITSVKTAGPSTAIKSRGHRQRPPTESVDAETIARLIAEVESGIPSEKLRRRGRPAIGDEAASTYSVRLPDDLVSLIDGRSEIDGVTRGETIRRALIDYLTK